jgi:hypothetical protein
MEKPNKSRSSSFSQPFVIVGLSDREIIEKTKGTNVKIKLGMVAMENGAYYEGEWMNGLRSG